MVEQGKNVWPERTAREVADTHNALTREEKVRSLLRRCGQPEASIEDMQGQDEELALYLGNPVAQVRILLYREAADLLGSEEARKFLRNDGQAPRTPEEWTQQYVGRLEGLLYVDVTP